MSVEVPEVLSPDTITTTPTKGCPDASVTFPVIFSGPAAYIGLQLRKKLAANVNAIDRNDVSFLAISFCFYVLSVICL